MCEAVNSVGSAKRTQAEVKKKWSHIKVDVKRKMAAHLQSVAKTGGGQEKRGPTLFGAIMGDIALSGVVGAHVGDSDYPRGKKKTDDILV